MYFAHPLKIFALVKARDEDMHSPQQAGNLLHSKSSSRISIVQMYSQQQWITSVHRVEAGISNWQGIPHLASSIFCSATYQCELASCLTLVEPYCFPSYHTDFPLRKAQVTRALCPKLRAFLRTTAFDYKFWRRDYTSAYCNSFSCYSKIVSIRQLK